MELVLEGLFDLYLTLVFTDCVALSHYFAKMVRETNVWVCMNCE